MERGFRVKHMPTLKVGYVKSVLEEEVEFLTKGEDENEKVEVVNSSDLEVVYDNKDLVKEVLKHNDVIICKFGEFVYSREDDSLVNVDTFAPVNVLKKITLRGLSYELALMGKTRAETFRKTIDEIFWRDRKFNLQTISKKINQARKMLPKKRTIDVDIYKWSKMEWDKKHAEQFNLKNELDMVCETLFCEEEELDEKIDNLKGIGLIQSQGEEEVEVNRIYDIDGEVRNGENGKESGKESETNNYQLETKKEKGKRTSKSWVQVNDPNLTLSKKERIEIATKELQISFKLDIDYPNGSRVERDLKSGVRQVFGTYSADEYEILDSINENSSMMLVGSKKDIKRNWPKIKSIKTADLLAFIIKADYELQNLIITATENGRRLKPPGLLTLASNDVKVEMAHILDKQIYQLTNLDVEAFLREAIMDPKIKLEELIDQIMKLNKNKDTVEDLANYKIAKTKQYLSLFKVTEKLDTNKFDADRTVKAILFGMPEEIKRIELKHWKDHWRHKRQFMQYLKVLTTRFAKNYPKFPIDKEKGRRDGNQKERNRWNHNKNHRWKSGIKVNRLEIQEDDIHSDDELMQDDEYHTDDIQDHDSDVSLTPLPDADDEEDDDDMENHWLEIYAMAVSQRICYLCYKKGHINLDCPDSSKYTEDEKMERIKAGMKMFAKSRNHNQRLNRGFKKFANPKNKGFKRFSNSKNGDLKKFPDSRKNDRQKQYQWKPRLKVNRLDVQDTESNDDGKLSYDDDDETDEERSIFSLFTINLQRQSIGNELQIYSLKQSRYGEATIGDKTFQYINDTGCLGGSVLGINIYEEIKDHVKTIFLPEKIPCRAAWTTTTSPVVYADKKIIVDITLGTDEGPLTVNNVELFVLSTEMDAIFFGENLTERLGLPTQRQMMNNAAKQQLKLSVNLVKLDPRHDEIVLANMQKGDSVLIERLDTDNEDEIMPLNFFTDEERPLDTDIAEARAQTMKEIDTLVGKMPNKAYRTEVKELLIQYIDVFRDTLTIDGPTKLPRYDIELKEGVERKFYAYSPKYTLQQMDFMNKEFDKFERAGMISKGPPTHMVSPVLVLPKPNSSDLRIVINMKQANANVKKMQTTPVHMSQIRSCLKGAKIFATWDMTSGYWQLRWGPIARKNYAFKSHAYTYYSDCTLQGSTNGGAMQQHASNHLCGDKLFKKTNGLAPYQDDVIAYAQDEATLLTICEYFFQRLEKYNFKLKLRKSELFVDKVKWLGYEITPEGINQPMTRITAITTLERPDNAGLLTHFLGSINWIRGHLGPYYASIVGPLLDMKKQAIKLAGSSKTSKLRKIKLKWDDTTLRAWKDILDLVKHKCHTLRYPAADDQINVFTDASDFAYGALISYCKPLQPGEQIWSVDHYPVGFLSGRFNQTQQNWTTLDKEAFAIIQTVEAYSNILDSQQYFHLYTDSKNLYYIFHPVKFSTNKATRGRLMRWSIILSRHSYMLHHIPGEQNLMADLLSRMAVNSDAPPAGTTPPIFMYCIHLNVVHTSTYLNRLAHHNDPGPKNNILDSTSTNTDEPKPRRSRRLVKLNYAESTGSGPSDRNTPKDTSSVSTPVSVDKPASDALDSVVSPDLPSVPSLDFTGLETAEDILRYVHNYQHDTPERMAAIIGQIYEWEDLLADCTVFYNRCTSTGCLEKRYRATKLQPTLQGLHPNHIVGLDFLRLEPTPEGYIGCLSMRDFYSLFCLFLPVKRETHMEAIRGIAYWASISRFPNHVLVDRGTHFINAMFEGFLSYYGTPLLSAIGKQSHGSTEVMNRSIQRLLRAMCADYNFDSTRWPELLLLAQHKLNNRSSPTLANYCPLQLFMAQTPSRPLDFVVTDDAEVLAQVDIDYHDKYHELLLRMNEIRRNAVIVGEWKRHQARASKNRRRRVARIQAGDSVLFRNPRGNKLAPRWIGPVTVEHKYSDRLFVITDPVTRRRKRVHADQLQLVPPASA